MAPTEASARPPDACLDQIEDLSREIDSRGFHQADISANAPAISEFLSMCADSLTDTDGNPTTDLTGFLPLRDTFIKAGLQSLAARHRLSNSDWLQIGVRPVEDAPAHRELCQQIATLARRLISDSAIHDFFYMNKDPGMRLRFRRSSGDARDVSQLVYAEARRWKDKGLIDYVEHGVYEPETQLFGGPASMPYVHSLFTVDSLFWLDYHSHHGDSGTEASPAWVASLAVLRTVFADLGIRGWEDVGVWDRIRDNAGRQLGEFKASFPAFDDIARDIRDIWSRSDQIAGRELDPALGELIDRYAQAISAGARNWRIGYFSQPGATMGPREAAAFFVIFHWNRAALSATEQAIVAESLAGREV